MQNPISLPDTNEDKLSGWRKRCNQQQPWLRPTGTTISQVFAYYDNSANKNGRLSARSAADSGG
ncbi:hypothetical protein WG68_17460 [Arsukibacterium ikkense]|uniref:Uncharacterized protein n=1 Tax=Arsukibacterium ikkense TaxID=336831 RepID=A0A0M2V172_9GAMM|nr:hypothetical protein WG68_17460 [Arsukibacterium ikkense]